MKIVIFTHSQYSHFATSMQIVKRIKEHSVYFFYDAKFEIYIPQEKCNITFIKYSSEIDKFFVDIKKEYQTIDDGLKAERDIDSIEGMIREASFSYEFMLRCSKVYFNSLIDIIKRIKPDCIFRDSCCLFGRYIGDYFKIPIVGFTTSSTIVEDEQTYSKRSFLEMVFNYNLNLFDDTWVNKIYVGIKDEFQKLSDKYEIRQFPINYLFDPDEKINFCFGLPFTVNYKKNYLYLKPFLFENIVQLPLIQDRNCIYVSAGSTISFPLIIYNFLLNIAAKSQMLYYVTFIYSGSNYIKLHHLLPTNVKMERRHNQLQVLKESNLFISHGGYNSLLESIFYEVPLLILPMCSDQFFDAEYAQRNGIALYLDYNTIDSSQDLRHKMDEIITNKCFYENVKRLKRKIQELGTFEEFVINLEALLNN